MSAIYDYQVEDGQQFKVIGDGNIYEKVGYGKIAGNEDMNCVNVTTGLAARFGGLVEVELTSGHTVTKRKAEVTRCHYCGCPTSGKTDFFGAAVCRDCQ